jgi:hypothetical protein
MSQIRDTNNPDEPLAIAHDVRIVMNMLITLGGKEQNGI